ncbi:MAG TPA: hypothetical protein VFA18_25210 [Gemmataceae bacterium]|nr:hypothetical protein [Gemmataceae bacterium]
MNTSPHATNRDSQGRFTRGNPGGPGNPYYRRQAQLKRQLLACVSEEDVQAVMQTLVGLARGGNLAAIKLFLEYTVGKPSKEVDPDQEELHEWHLQQQTPRLEQVLEVAANGIETPRANQVTRELVPIVGNCQLQTVSQHLLQGAEATAEQIALPRVEPPPPPDRNGGKRSSASARCLTAAVPPAVATEENGDRLNVSELLAEVVRAVHSVENGPERAARCWHPVPGQTEPPVFR